MSAGCVASYESDNELDWPEDLPRRRGKATPAAAFQPEDAGSAASAASAARGLGDLGMLGFFLKDFLKVLLGRNVSILYFACFYWIL